MVTQPDHQQSDVDTQHDGFDLSALPRPCLAEQSVNTYSSCHRVVVIIVLQFGLSSPRQCDDDVAGREYMAAVCMMFGSFATSLLLELLMIIIGSRGAPIIQQGMLLCLGACMRTQAKLNQLDSIPCCVQATPWRCPSGEPSSRCSIFNLSLWVLEIGIASG